MVRLLQYAKCRLRLDPGVFDWKNLSPHISLDFDKYVEYGVLCSFYIQRNALNVRPKKSEIPPPTDNP